MSCVCAFATLYQELRQPFWTFTPVAQTIGKNNYSVQM